MSAPVGIPTVVLDTSVVVKWVRREEMLATEALSWFTRLLAGDFYVAAPSLLAYELANGLVYKADLTPEHIADFVQALYTIGLHWFGPSPALLARATVIARAYGITMCDASFVALAEALQADMITADAKALRRLEMLPFVHFLGE